MYLNLQVHAAFSLLLMALQYIEPMTSKKVIGSIFLQKKGNLHYHKVNDNHDKIGDSPYE